MIVDDSFFNNYWYDVVLKNKTVVVISGGFDFISNGHIECAKEAKSYGDILVAIINGNNFLINKKGFYNLDECERAENVNELESVDYVLVWRKQLRHVDEALKLIRPHFFCKGGTRSGDSFMPKDELEVCKEIGCIIKYGVGGQYEKQAVSELQFQMEKFNV